MRITLMSFFEGRSFGPCETASKGKEGSKDRELTAVRPNIGNLGEEKEREETGEEEREEQGGETEGVKEEQGEEAEGSKGVNRGIKPSKKEVEEHERTHLPFRNWCKHCVFGKAKSSPHRKSEEKKGEKPVISIDYMYLH